jgi:hypothetical protein
MSTGDQINNRSESGLGRGGSSVRCSGFIQEGALGAGNNISIEGVFLDAILHLLGNVRGGDNCSDILFDVCRAYQIFKETK